MLQRLFIAILTAAVLAVICMFFVMRWSFSRGLLDYVNNTEQERISKALVQAYEERGNWDFLEDDPALWPESLKQIMLISKEEPRLLLLDDKLEPLYGNIGTKKNDKLSPIKNNGRIVSYLLVPPQKKLSTPYQLSFIKQQELAMLIIVATILLLSIFISIIVARRLVRPINTLTKGIHQLSTGDYTVRVPVTSTDELGRLAGDFNALALALEHNEESRQQWVADISHELRTPLTILRGEIEAIQDGIRPADAKALDSLHTEIMRLGRLVDDLYQLSLFDVGALTYRKDGIDPISILRQVMLLFQDEFKRKNIVMTFFSPDSLNPPLIFGDAERLEQLFTNLFENSLKYTDAGGEMQIHCRYGEGRLYIAIQDSPPGVPLPEHEKLFDRLYRVEASRNRGTGGMGLGLTICQNIIKAHEGTIAACPSPLGGLQINISLPLIEELQ